MLKTKMQNKIVLHLLMHVSCSNNLIKNTSTYLNNLFYKFCCKQNKSYKRYNHVIYYFFKYLGADLKEQKILRNESKNFCDKRKF